MTDRAYIISRTLECKIEIAEHVGQNTMLVTLDVLKEILSLLKEQETSNLYKCPNCGTWVSADGERENFCKPVSISATDYDGISCE